MRPSIRVGLPYLPGDEGHPFLNVLREAGLPVLISVGSLYRPEEGFRRLQLSAWRRDVALDSAGFVAMARFNGYRWTVDDYVDQVVRNFPGDCDDDTEEPHRSELPHPWTWWSAPDYCCEPEIASDRAEVERRMEMTAESLSDTLGALASWRYEGENGTPDPMPILQGRTPEDYQRSVEVIRRVVVEADPCICHLRPDDCEATWHNLRGPPDLPELVGVGSVCRRAVGGPDGLLRVLHALDEALPAHTRVHLFGVKAYLKKLGALARRVASVDSMAWDSAASWEAQKLTRASGTRVSCSLAMREEHLRRWIAAQQPEATGQRKLF